MPCGGLQASRQPRRRGAERVGKVDARACWPRGRGHGGERGRRAELRRPPIVHKPRGVDARWGRARIPIDTQKTVGAGLARGGISRYTAGDEIAMLARIWLGFDSTYEGLKQSLADDADAIVCVSTVTMRA